MKNFINIVLIFIHFFLFNNCTDNHNNKGLLHKLTGIYMYNAATSCSSDKLNKTQAGRIYQTGFETTQDFSNFYSVPQNYQNSSSHDLSTEQVRSGSKSHKGWIYAKGPNCSFPTNCNHRGYPTIQLHKLAGGGFKTPVYFEFYTYLSMSFTTTNDWFSFATFSMDASDSWNRVALINTDSKGYAYLMHVPVQGQGITTYQNKSLSYPQNQWVKISGCLDFNPVTGYAKVWQNDVLISTADVRGGCSLLEQAHFGLYAYPGMSSGTIYNDDLLIKEIASCP